VELTYNIGTLSELTGLSQYTIRAWEKRYHALTPERTETNRRIYHPEDLERLTLLRDGVHAGHSIGHIAPLTTNQLRALHSPFVETVLAEPVASPPVEDPTAFVISCQIALEHLDAEALESALSRAQATFGAIESINRVILPFIRIIDSKWTDGSIGISHEHLASSVLGSHLMSIRKMMSLPSNTPKLLVATPAHQQHELGALLVAIVAATQGWSVVYLGVNVPARDIANAAIQGKVKAIALSIVTEGDEPSIRHDITELRHRLPATVPIFAGGRAANSYSGVLHQFGVQILNDLWALRAPLRQLA